MLASWWRGPFWHSVRLKLLLVAVLLVVGLYALMQANVARGLYAMAEANLQQVVQLTAETLNLAVSSHTTADRLPELGDYFETLVQADGQGLVYLALLDAQGNHLVETMDTPDRLPVSPLSVGEQMASGMVQSFQPILIRDGEVGVLHFGLSSRAFVTSMERVRQENLLVVAVVLMFLLMLLVVAGIKLNRRVMAFLQMTRALADGRYDARLPDAGQDEFSQLGQYINRMAQAVAERVQALESSQAQIEALNETLEHRVTERTAELAAALRELQEAQASLVQAEKLAGLGAVVAAVAHELSTPIGNALMVASSCEGRNARFREQMAQGLKRSVLDAYVQDSLAAAELVQRNLKRASELINSFKQVAVDQASSQRRSFDLAVMLGDLVSTLSPMLQDPAIDLTLSLSPDIRMDSYPGPLGQIVTNLIQNALVHAFDGQAVKAMRLETRQLSPGWVLVRFDDFGNGIPAEHVTRIFDPFFTTRQNSGGTGLGLHIVHNLVTGLLGGTIEVETNRGVGTAFVMRLPQIAPVRGEGSA